MTLQQRVQHEWKWNLVLVFGMCALQLNAQVTTEVAWQRCIGGSDFDQAFNLCAISDGGFVSVGTVISSDGDATGSHGAFDLLVTKLNSDGTIEWNRMLGGSSQDLGVTCLEASDGSIMITGAVASDDGDVSGNHGLGDIWLAKLTPSGVLLWQRAYGGSGAELGGSIQEASDGGFVIIAETTSVDGDVIGYHPNPGVQDTWIFKVDASGQLLWSRALGGSGFESGGKLIRTSDGGYLVNFSSTESDDGDVVNNHGEGDCWLVKLNANGAVEWARTIGGSLREFGTDALELANGDILMLGTTASSDGDVSINRGGNDVMLVKLNSVGDLLWERTFGGSLDDDCRSLMPASDGGFLLTGSSTSSDGDLSANAGERDVWVVKVDDNGTLLWQRSYGGALDDFAFMQSLEDGGYLLTGTTNSIDGDVQGHHGDRDLWLCKITSDAELVWQRCLGGSQEDWGYVRAHTLDNGLVALGYTDSNDGDVSGNHGGRDIWVVKLRVTEPALPPEPLECALFVPNAFSPNNTKKNDTHCIHGTDCVTSMTFNIFDRWGNKVFESTDPTICWDGQYKGQLLDPAVFVYHLSATLTNGEAVEQQGNITLVR